MNVAFYCQHVLGIGHFHRSLEICRAIGRHHPTTLIVGGPPVEIDLPDIEVLRLPGLQMDSEFRDMVPCSPELSLEEVKAARKELLFDHFQKKRPEIFITELYPFGRKAFRFELDPLLAAINDGSLPDCLCFCSVRDILVEKKTGREKFEDRVVQTINSYFDGILVHADPRIISLQETFGRLSDIAPSLCYTGFVTGPDPGQQALEYQKEIRRRLSLAPGAKLIVASIGGGNVGSELLSAVSRAFTLVERAVPAHLQLFCGPYCSETTYRTLQANSRGTLTVDRFTDHFPAWLKTADLSISMAGYNTCMNLVQAGIPALVYPFRQNREQQLRAQRLGRKMSMAMLADADFAPHLLAGKILQQLERPRLSADINLDGAEGTARQIEAWYKERALHD